MLSKRRFAATVLTLALVLAVDSAPGARAVVAPSPAKVGYANVIDIPDFQGKTATQFVCQLCTTPTGGKSQPDYLATIDFDPASSTYGKVLARTPMPSTNPEIHHMHVDAQANRIIVYDLYQSKAIIFGTSFGSLRPALRRVVNLGEASAALLGIPTGGDHPVGYGTPHESYRLPSGNFLIAMGGIYDPSNPALNDSAPGGFVEMTPNGDVVNAFPHLEYSGGVLKNNMFEGMGLFGLDYDARRKMLVHVDTMVARQFKCGVGLDPTTFGKEVVIWNYDHANPGAASIFQKVTMPAPVVTSPYFLHNTAQGLDVIYVTTFTAGVWALSRPAGTQLPFVITPLFPVLAPASGVAHLRLSPDEKVLYVSDTSGNTIDVLSIALSPLVPIPLQQVTLKEVHLLKFSRDGHTLFASNGLASTLGFQFRNPPFDPHYGLRSFTVRPDGTLTDERLLVDALLEPDAPPVSDGVFFGDFFLKENPQAYV